MTSAWIIVVVSMAHIRISWVRNILITRWIKVISISHIFTILCGLEESINKNLQLLSFGVPKFDYNEFIICRIQKMVSQVLRWCGSHMDFKGLVNGNHSMESRNSFLTCVSKTPSMILRTIDKINVAIYFRTDTDGTQPSNFSVLIHRLNDK